MSPSATPYSLSNGTATLEPLQSGFGTKQVRLRGHGPNGFGPFLLVHAPLVPGARRSGRLSPCAKQTS